MTDIVQSNIYAVDSNGNFVPASIQGDGTGGVLVTINGVVGGNVFSTTPSDALVAGVSLEVAGFNSLFNGVNWDRERGNIQEIILASAVRSANNSSADFTNYNGKGGHFIIDITAVTAAQTVTFTVEGKDVISGNYYPILISTALSAVSTNTLKIYPGIIASPNLSASDILPRIYRVSVAHSGGGNFTYSVSNNVNV